MIRNIFIILVAFFAATAFAENYFVEIASEKSPELRSFLEANGHDVVGYNPATGRYEVITQDPRALEHNLAIVRAQNSDWQILSVTPSQPFAEYSKQLREEETYFNSQQVKDFLDSMEKSYPQYAKVYDLNEWLGVARTEEGRSMYALHVSANPSVLEDKPRVMFIGQHHARELMTHHAVMDAAKDLLSNSQYKNWIQNTSIWFVPVVNPDGLDFVFTSDRMWRKNRSHNSGGSRGVDLNRNYEFKWGTCGNNSSSGTSVVFKGPSANSEPEVQVMDQLNAKLQCQYIISYHSSGNEVLYPYVCGDIAESKTYYDLRDRLASHIGFGKRVASSSGEDYEHHYNRYGSVSFLLEIGTSFQPAFSTYRNTVWPSVQKVMPFILEEMNTPHIHISVKDESGAPIQANLSIQEIQFKENEIRKTDEFGSYRWKVLPGKYSLTVNAKGYESKSLEITADGKSKTYSVELKTN